MRYQRHHDRKAARAIALTIIDEFYGASARPSFAGVDVQDAGQTWKIEQLLKKGVYGGYVTFQIDKCTGGVQEFRLYPD